MNNSTSCASLAWSAEMIDAIQPSLYVCIVALVFHSIFWFSIFTHPTLRQWKSMQWLYAFLILDLLLILRFFILYAIRNSSACVAFPIRLFICYFESAGDVYLNYLQGYIILALNICRYFQITHGGADVYSIYRRSLFIVHGLIYCLPMLILILEIKIGWAISYYRHGGSCDLDYPLLSTRLLNPIFGYFVPTLLALLFLMLSLHHVRLSVARINTEQILNNRLKHHRLLVLQSSVFYSAWILLWSPHVIASQYVDISSTLGAIAQVLNYVEVALDPIIISTLDARFLKVMQKTFKRIKRQVVPAANN